MVKSPQASDYIRLSNMKSTKQFSEMKTQKGGQINHAVNNFQEEEKQSTAERPINFHKLGEDDSSPFNNTDLQAFSHAHVQHS